MGRARKASLMWEGNGELGMVGDKSANELANAVLATQVAILAGMIDAKIVDPTKMRD